MSATTSVLRIVVTTLFWLTVAMAAFDTGLRARAPGTSRTLCTEDDAGWEVEMPYPQAVRATSPAGSSWVLRGTAVLARLGVERSCVAWVAGVAEGDALSADRSSGGPGHVTIPASLLLPETRLSLRCWQR